MHDSEYLYLDVELLSRVSAPADVDTGENAEEAAVDADSRVVTNAANAAAGARNLGRVNTERRLALADDDAVGHCKALPRVAENVWGEKAERKKRENEE